jgi:phosphatidylcholine synthase
VRPHQAWAVHLFTATGAILALLAVAAAVDGDFRAAFLYLFATTMIDTVDGSFARLARVTDRLPWFDGAKLDDIVDYLTFVFVPALLLYWSGLVPEGLRLPAASAMLLSSAYGFNRADAKSADHFFTGFPSYWNIVVFYLYVAGLDPRLNAAIVLLLSALVFAPVGFVYPSHTPAFRSLTLILGVMWGAIVLMLVLALPDVSRAMLMLSLIFPVYYAVLSVILHRRRR